MGDYAGGLLLEADFASSRFVSSVCFVILLFGLSKKNLARRGQAHLALPAQELAPFFGCGCAALSPLRPWREASSE